MKKRIYFLIIMLATQCNRIKSDATIDGLRKLITTLAQEDKAYITLYAVELNVSYDNYLNQRRKQYCLEIKNYVNMFSPKLTSEMLTGKIDQEKLDWVNNICPDVLPNTISSSSTISRDNNATPAQSTNNSSQTSSTTPSASMSSTNNLTSTSNLIKKDAVKAFHSIKVD